MFSLLILFFCVAIVTSFLCSLWEAVLLSISPAYARLAAEQGKATGHHLQAFKNNIDRPLAAILTLNTIAHTVGAIGVGQQATIIWADANPLITGLVVPAVMTLAVLLLSEIVPKTIGANQWQRLAPFTVLSLRVIIALLYPLVWACQFITRRMNHGDSASVLTRSEFLALAEIGEKDGVFAAGETSIIQNLLRFRDVTARNVMTPRLVVKTAVEEDTVDDFLRRNADMPLQFSRIPLHRRDNHEDMTGYVLRNEILECKTRGAGDTHLATLKRPLRAVEESSPLPELFDWFVANRDHIALVMDDYGGMSGIVTMEDVIETLLGLEIVDELDSVTDMQVLARRNWERRARALGLLTVDEDVRSGSGSAPSQASGDA
jgi:CBS domain containing-hemolysin-like protein